MIMSSTIKVMNIHISLLILMIVADTVTVEYSNIFNFFFLFMTLMESTCLVPESSTFSGLAAAGNMRPSVCRGSCVAKCPAKCTLCSSNMLAVCKLKQKRNVS